MNIHKNASMTPRGRAHLMREIDRIGLRPAATAAGLSERTASKWRGRWANEGAPDLLDRSSLRRAVADLIDVDRDLSVVCQRSVTHDRRRRSVRSMQAASAALDLSLEVIQAAACAPDASEHKMLWLRRRSLR